MIKINIDGISKLVSINDILTDETYNLSVSTYVESIKVTEEIDLTSLNEEILKVVTEENELRNKIDDLISRYKEN